MLVEYLEGKLRYFDWYNLKTGDKNVLDTAAYNCKLMKVVNTDDILFTTDGVTTFDGNKYFPQVIQFSRDPEATSEENDFRQIMKDLYLPINQGIDMGVKSGTLKNMTVSTTGLKVQFGPIKGQELGYYSGFTAIPPTKILYNKVNNQLILEFKDSFIGNDIKKSIITGNNKYIKSIYIGRSNSKIILTINLKNVAKYYTADIPINSTDIDFKFLETLPNYD